MIVALHWQSPEPIAVAANGQAGEYRFERMFGQVRAGAIRNCRIQCGLGAIEIALALRTRRDILGDQVNTRGNSAGQRRRISGLLGLGPRRPHIVTDSGDLWALECENFDSALVGRQVTAEGVLVGISRIKVDWVGSAGA